MNEKKRLLQNTGLIAIGNMGAKVISFLLLPMYTSILTTEEYGTYDYIVAVCAFLFPVVTMCMHEAMFRFIIEKGDDERKFTEIVSHAFFVVLAGIGIFVLISFVANIFLKLSYFWYFDAYLITGILYMFSVNLLRGKGDIKSYAIISTGKNILQVALNVITVAVLRLGFTGLIVSMCISESIAFLITAIKCKLWRYIRFNKLSRMTFQEMLTYSLPLVPDAVCAQIINISDRVIISNFMGTGANGIYSVSYKFPNIIETVFHYFYTAWSESASRVIDKDKDEAGNYYLSLYRLIDNVMFAIILLFIAGMPIMYRIFVRGDYISGFQYVPILLIAMYFDCLGKFYSGVFTAYKETKVMATTTVIAAVVNIGVDLVMISKFGLYAAAISTLVADFVMVELRRRDMKKYLQIKLEPRKVAAEIIVTIIVCALYSYQDWTRILIGIAIALTYAIVANINIVKKIFSVTKRKIGKR